MVLRPVGSYYTGREKQLAVIGRAFEDNTFFSQKRLVIYGLGGSGKTELALKYAERHQDKYWGVFFVDGTSRKHALGSYMEVATIGGVEPNDKAAKNWLTTRALPWLLIVDNVDDEAVDLDDLLPPGTKGSVLITSQNPAHKTYGNVGQRYLGLELMEKEEAIELVLKAAEEPSPWTLPVKDSANVICQALGYLPLTLVHAAKAILNGLCSWSGTSGYLTFYERETDRIRRERLRRRDGSPSRSTFEDDDNLNVLSSYEILYQSLESSQEEKFKDAVDLLHIFSYLHFQNIRFDTFMDAALNQLKEAEQQKIDLQEDKELQAKLVKPRRRSWITWRKELSLALMTYSETPAPLPMVLRNAGNLSRRAFESEVHVRLSKALGVLVKRSLVMKQD